MVRLCLSLAYLIPSQYIYRGIHYLAKRVRERLGFIAEEIKQYDIVGLQEVCTHLYGYQI